MPINDDNPSADLSPDEFDELDTILDDLRSRSDETPQWEFCEGFMAALLVCRRAIATDEYLPVLLDSSESADDADSASKGLPQRAFASEAQAARFMELWQRRWNQIARALAIEVESLDDERAYHPEVMDVRGAVASLPQDQRPELAAEELPSFAQVWAIGFMYAVENWPDDWAAPRDKEAQKWLNQSLDAIVALTEDDTDEPTLAVFDETGPPSVSEARFNAFADGVWAVYDLHQLWRSLGPRVESVRKTAEPGRNDPCHCGSGKKYKKCHGA